jgi:hypothetical protein
METNDSWRNTQVLWDHYRDGLGTNAATEPPLEKQSVVWVGDYSKRHAERFEFLLKFWHFSNNDKLFKLESLLNLLKARFSSVDMPNSVVTIDETMIPLRDRLFSNNIFLVKHF